MRQIGGLIARVPIGTHAHCTCTQFRARRSGNYRRSDTYVSRASGVVRDRGGRSAAAGSGAGGRPLRVSVGDCCGIPDLCVRPAAGGGGDGRDQQRAVTDDEHCVGEHGARFVVRLRRERAVGVASVLSLGRRACDDDDDGGSGGDGGCGGGRWAARTR